MAIGTNAAVDGLATAKRVWIPIAHETCMIDTRFVLGDLQSQERKIGRQGRGFLRASIPNFDQVLQQIEEGLRGAQLLDQSGRHQRLRACCRRFDLVGLDLDRFAVGVAQSPSFGIVIDQQTGDQFTVGQSQRDRLVSFMDGLGGFEDRLDELLVGEFVRGR